MAYQLKSINHTYTPRASHTFIVYVSPEDFQALSGRVANAEDSKMAEDALLVTVNGLVFTARCVARRSRHIDRMEMVDGFAC